MGFRGYRIATVKTGIFPERLIAWESMQTQPEQVAELQAYETSLNDLVRKTALHKRFKMTFTTCQGITNVELETINKWIDGAIINEQEQKIPIIAWNDRKNAYYYYECYIPNMTYQEQGHGNGLIKYKPITLTFISYGQGSMVSDEQMVKYESSWT